MKLNKWQKVISLGVFLTLVFSCLGASVAMAFSGDMNHETQTQKSVCCDQEAPNFVLVKHAKDFVLPLLSIDTETTAGSYITLGLFVLFVVGVLNFYFIKIRQFIGSFKIFEHFSRLFSLGILHTKAW